MLDHSPYTGTERVIHLVLASWANEGNDHLLWANQETIAVKAKCSTRTVRSAVKQMVDDGYLEIVETGVGKKHPVYRLLDGNRKSATDEIGNLRQANRKSATDSAPYTNCIKESKKNHVDAKRRDLIFETLCEVAGIDWTENNDFELGPVRKMTKILKEMDPAPTPDEIMIRADLYKTRWPDLTFTVTGLLKNWSQFNPDVQPALAEKDWTNDWNALTWDYRLLTQSVYNKLVADFEENGVWYHPFREGFTDYPQPQHPSVAFPWMG